MKKSYKWTIAIVLICVIAVILILDFSSQVGRISANANEARLAEVTTNKARSIVSVIDNATHELENLSSNLLQFNDFTGPDAMKYLSAMLEKSHHSYLAVITPNGRIYSCSNETADIATGDFLPHVLLGGNAVLTARLDGSHAIGIAVPIYKNGIIIGGLCGLSDSSVLTNEMLISMFSGAGYYSILDGKGNYLVRTSADITQSNYSNIFELMDASTFNGMFDTAVLRSDISAKRSGYGLYTYNKRTNYIYYMPLGIEDWYITSVISHNYVPLQNTKIRNAATLLVIKLSVVFILLLLYIIYSNRKAQRALLLSKEYYEGVLNNLQLPLSIADNNHKWIFLNDAALALANSSLSSLVGQPCTDDATVGSGIASLDNADCKTTYSDNNGKSYMLNTSVVKNSAQTQTGVVEIIQDISEVVATRRELETITNSIPGGVIQCSSDESCEFIYMSDGFIDMLGYSRAEIRHQFKNSFWNTIHPDDAESIREQIYSNLTPGGTLELQYRSITNSGNTMWILCKCAPRYDSTNNIILHCVLIDITDRILTQQKLMQRSLEFETVSENLPGGILMTYMDKSLTIAYANDGYLSMLGLSGENILGAEALTFIPPKDRDMVSATIHEQLATSDYISLEHRLLVYGGGEIWVSANSKRIISVNGKPMAVWVLVNISRIKETEQALRISEERYRVAIKNTNHIIFDYNVASKELLYSSDAVNAYGLPQLVHNAPQAISDSGAICPESMAEYLSCFDRIIAGEATTCCTVKSKTLDGTIVWNKITLSAIYDDSGNAIRAVGSIEDISHEKELEQKAQKEERYRDLLTKNALINYEIDFTNNVYLRGHEHISSLSNLANDYSKILAFISKRNVYVDDRAKFLKTFSVEHVLSEFNAGVTRIELEYRKIDSGDPIWVKCSLCLLFDDDLNIVRGFSIVNDINEQKQHEFTLRDRAERDLQTGLYNKVSTEQRIDDFLISDDAQNGISAFMLIDIDNFKLVNDRLGHAYGDTALLKMAQILISLFRENDVIGRIGGDEFVVFVKNLHASELAEHKAADICRAFRDLFTVADDMRITASVGISILPYDGSSFDELYQKADIALYRAKNAGKDSFALFSSETITE